MTDEKIEKSEKHKNRRGKNRIKDRQSNKEKKWRDRRRRGK